MSLSDVPSIDIDDEVYYHELEDSQAGLCVERSDGALSWSPVKISRRHVRPDRRSITHMGHTCHSYVPV